MKYIALDFETSGLVAGTHAPVSLGVALMEDGIVIDSQEWLFAPPTKDGKIIRAYDVVALEISGTPWTKIKKEGLPHVQVCKELLAFAIKHDARDTPVVAFNAPFDLAWYSDLLFLGGSWNQTERCFQTFLPPLAGPWQCARLMAATRVAIPRYTLDGVAEYYGLARTQQVHGALEDAILAGQVYAALSQQVKVAA